jgi:hypothetical protein
MLCHLWSALFHSSSSSCCRVASCFCLQLIRTSLTPFELAMLCHFGTPLFRLSSSILLLMWWVMPPAKHQAIIRRWALYMEIPRLLISGRRTAGVRRWRHLHKIDIGITVFDYSYMRVLAHYYTSTPVLVLQYKIVLICLNTILLVLHFR